MITEIKIVTQWDDVITDLRNIFIEKIRLYGIGRYQKFGDEFNYWMCFSDVYRKTLRLEQLTIIALSDIQQGACSYSGSDVKEAQAKLIDDYKDIANYAIMAVQILEKKNET